MKSLFSILAALALVSCGAGSNSSLVISDGYVMEVPPVQETTAVFMKISNGSDAEERLLSVSSSISKKAEIHKMVMEGDVMRMEPMEFLVIPKESSVELKRGGLHLMLFGLEKKIKAGDLVLLTLEFKNSGTLKIELPVKAIE